MGGALVTFDRKKRIIVESSIGLVTTGSIIKSNTTTSSKSGRQKQTQKNQQGMPRRSCLKLILRMGLVALPLTGWLISPQISLADSNSLEPVTTNIPSECQSGALMAESAVPGAYDQICMNLPLRTIPLRLPNQTEEIQIQQEGAGPGKTGLAVWNSALLLGRVLEAIVATNPNFFRDKQVAELGCGTALVSIMASRLGAKSVWATDGNPAAVALSESNFRRNNISYTATVSERNIDENVVSTLQWGELQVPLEWMGKVDVILGSDLTYNSGSWRVLAETMDTLLSQNGFVLYLSLGHSGFNVRGEVDGFVNVAKQSGLSVKALMDLPFTLPRGVSTLDAFLQDFILPSEQSILSFTGGAQLLVIGRK